MAEPSTAKPWLDVPRHRTKEAPRTMIPFPCECGARAGTKDGCTTVWIRCRVRLAALFEWREKQGLKL